MKTIGIVCAGLAGLAFSIGAPSTTAEGYQDLLPPCVSLVVDEQTLAAALAWKNFALEAAVWASGTTNVVLVNVLSRERSEAGTLPNFPTFSDTFEDLSSGASHAAENAPAAASCALEATGAGDDAFTVADALLSPVGTIVHALEPVPGIAIRLLQQADCTLADKIGGAPCEDPLPIPELLDGHVSGTGG